ncbi:MAG: hypothetical protein NVSMB14_06080 [Isosphaeraceae bacterium]
MTLVELLDRHRLDILRIWMQAVREEAPETRELSDEDLIDNFPLLFDRLILCLGGAMHPEAMPESKDHAANRRRQGIGLSTLLRGYLLLQQAIKGFAAARLGIAGGLESRTIDTIMFRAVEEAVLSYNSAKEMELSNYKDHSEHIIMALAHDIRTPLNAMTLTLTLMEMKHGAIFDNQDRDDLASIRAGITSVLDLHRGILDHGKLNAGVMVPNPSIFPLDEALARFVQIVKSLATYKEIAVIQELNSGVILQMDKGMLHQVVGNLLSNAIRYTKKGTITIRSRVAGEAIRIEVEDTGIGLSQEDQIHVFDEFFQVDRDGMSGARGYGLGLTVARRMARLLGGELTVDGELGRGSAFTLVFPTRDIVVPTGKP